MSINRRAPRCARRSAVARQQRGFTLVELLVAMAITTIILGTTMMAMNDAIKATDSATQITDLNNGLRTAMDMMVRDALQIGQGLPTGRTIGLPYGTNSTPIQLPGPIDSNFQLDGPSFCPPDPNDATPDNVCEQMTAVVPGPGRGPLLNENGQPTDMITMVEADSAFDQVPLTAFGANGASITVALPDLVAPIDVGMSPRGLNITNGGADDIDAGDLIMLTKGSTSVLVQVTRQPLANSQQIFFDIDDSLVLNQRGVSSVVAGVTVWSPAGTGAELRMQAPADTAAGANGLVNTLATRIRLITYYIDVTTNPLRPRLIRRMNNGHPTSFDNTLGTVIAFDVENLQISYDLTDGVNRTLTNVRMDDADLDGTGRCAPRACSPNQIRKVNFVLVGRSRLPLRTTRQFAHKTLMTQVSLRSLAFVDRYR
jgi:prepilin-type N-terminal cleavage/methylation domain-containing protein